jgi:protoporphyrinogen IX oxidase
MLRSVPYPALIAAHVLAVGIFLTGLALAAGSLPALTGAGTAVDGEEVRRLRALQRWVTSPALVLVWVLGVSMAVKAGWFAMGWLRLKLIFVLLLSGLHGWQMLTLRRLAQRRPVAGVGYRPLVAIAALTVAILALVTGKPF